MKKENGSGKKHSGKKAAKAKKKNPKKDLDKWYDNADLMIMLKVSLSTLARYRKKGKLPFNSNFGKILYPKEIVDSIMMQNLENKHLLE